MIEITRSGSPYPTIREDGTLFDGLVLPQAKKCGQCATKSCLEILKIFPVSERVDHFVCEFGFSVVSIPVSGGSLLVNGIYVPVHNTAMSKEMRKANRSRKIALPVLVNYGDAIKKLEPRMLEAIDSRATHAASGIHDVRTAVNLLYRNAEAIVRDIPGESMEEKIAGADADLKRLLVSVRLLKSRLDMASIVNNPESARFGLRRPFPVYKLFHRMVRLFEEEAHSRGITITMRGTSFRAPSLFDSFESIPLVLLDNAVKYSFPDTEIFVTVEDFQQRVVASVASYGLIVPPEDSPNIFVKNYRAPVAEKIASTGSGLGLYIAQTVAKANGFSISYKSDPSQHDDGVGDNIFSFAVY